MSEPKNNFSSFFHQIKFTLFKRVRLKKCLLSYSATSFFLTDIYRMVSFDKFAYSFIPVIFTAIWMSFLSFLSQKTYPGEFLRPKVILSRSYLRKFSVWRCAPSIINLSFFKNAIKSEPLGVRG